ncbi:MAG: CPBP family intramembrane glutamic endopeptidase [Rubrobacteraceae bacterium]
MITSKIRGWVKGHPIISFFILAYTITWLAFSPAILGYEGGLGQLFFMIAQFGPALAALIVILLSGASVKDWLRSIVRWRVAPRWYAIAIGLPVLFIAVESIVYGLLGNPLELSRIPGALAGFVPSLVFLTLIAGLGEEPGWRGFALPRLETRYAPVVATLVLGLAWAFWHLPLVFVDPRFPHGFTSLAPLVFMALLTLVGIALMAFFYTWIYNVTQSVLLVMLLHGSFNTATGAFPAPFDVLQRGVYVTLLVVQDITLLLAVVILVLATAGKLGYGAVRRGSRGR